MKVLDFILENSYDNSKSAQRQRSKNKKYQPQNGASAVLVEGDANKFKGTQETSTSSFLKGKKKKMIPKSKNNYRTRTKTWHHHSVCDCTQVGAGEPTSHSLSF